MDMDKDLEYILELLGSTVGRRTVALPDHPVDWVRVFSETAAQNVASIIYGAVAALPPEIGPEPGLMQAWKAHTVRTALRQMTAMKELAAVLHAAGQKGFTPIVFKGAILGRLYPEPLVRGSSDIDVLIDDSQEEMFFGILKAMGSPEEGVPNDHNHEHSYLTGSGTNFEVHKRLWEERTDSARFATLNSTDITDPATFSTVHFFGMELLTLGPRQQLCYMIYHMVKHFVVAGMGVRHLSDLALFYNAHKDEIDLQLTWAWFEKLGYTRFCEQVFAICIRYFTMDSSIFPGYAELGGEMEDRILNDIWAGGIFGKRTPARELSGRFLRQYYENENKRLPAGRFGLLISLLFPSADDLTRIDFIELSPNKAVAWFQRAGHLISRWFRRRHNKMPNCTIKERMDCAMTRMDMLEQMQLLKR